METGRAHQSLRDRLEMERREAVTRHSEELKAQDKGLEAPCREKPLEKSGLQPAAPNRLADRKHCALSTHPNPIYTLRSHSGE